MTYINRSDLVGIMPCTSPSGKMASRSRFGLATLLLTCIISPITAMSQEYKPTNASEAIDAIHINAFLICKHGPNFLSSQGKASEGQSEAKRRNVPIELLYDHDIQRKAREMASESFCRAMENYADFNELGQQQDTDLSSLSKEELLVASILAAGRCRVKNGTASKEDAMLGAAYAAEAAGVKSNDIFERKKVIQATVHLGRYISQDCKSFILPQIERNQSDQGKEQSREGLLLAQEIIRTRHKSLTKLLGAATTNAVWKCRLGNDISMSAIPLIYPIYLEASGFTARDVHEAGAQKLGDHLVKYINPNTCRPDAVAIRAAMKEILAQYQIVIVD